MARSLLVKIEGDASSLERAFKDSSRAASRFEGDVGKIGRGGVAASGLFRGLGRSIAFASTAFLGGFGLVTAIRASFAAFESLQQVGLQTEAVLKSTGSVAGVTAEHVKSLGEELSAATGVSQDVVRNSENLLLAFTNIRNVAGEGNDVFDQATQAALDLSAAWQTDLPTAAKTIGKALQDPLRGMQSLTRQGVLLDRSQRALIKRLVNTGDTLGAQRVILRQLQRQFGGSAEIDTFAFHVALLKNNLTDLGAKIVEGFTPALVKSLDQMTAWVTNAQNQERVMRLTRDVIGFLVESLKKLRDAFDLLNKITGSTKHTLEILLGVFVAYKGLKLAQTLATLAADFGLVGTAAATSTGEVAALKTELAFPATLNTSLGTTAGAVGAIGGSAAAATGEVAALKGSLLTMRSLGPILIGATVALAITETPQYKEFRKFIADNAPGNESTGKKLGKALFGSFTETLGTAFSVDPDVSPLAAGISKGRKRLTESLRRLGVIGTDRSVFDVRADASRRKEDTDFASRPGEEPPGLTKKQREEAAARGRQAREALRQQTQDRAQLAIDRAGLTKSTADDVSALRKYLALLQRRIRGQHDVLANEREAIGVEKQIADLVQAQKDAASQAVLDKAQLQIDRATLTKSVTDDIAALQKLNAILLKRIRTGKATVDIQEQQIAVEKQIRDLLEQRRDARQFKLLGLGPTGEDLIPGVGNLKRQLRNVRKTIDDTFLDTRKNRSLLAGIKKVLSDPGGVSDSVRDKIRTIIADLKNQLKQSSVDVTKFQQTARGQFTLAGAHPGGNLTINGGIHLHGIQDLKALENELARRAKARAKARRGNR